MFGNLRCEIKYREIRQKAFVNPWQRQEGLERKLSVVGGLERKRWLGKARSKSSDQNLGTNKLDEVIEGDF